MTGPLADRSGPPDRTACFSLRTGSGKASGPRSFGPEDRHWRQALPLGGPLLWTAGPLAGPLCSDRSGPLAGPVQ